MKRIKKKKMILTLIILVAITSIIYFLPLWGKLPQGEYLETLKTSSNFSFERNKFINQNQTHIDEIKKNSSTLKILMSAFSNPNKHTTPDIKLPEMKPDLEGFVNHKSGIHYIWLGHSTFMLNFDGTIILVDPVLSAHASPVFFMTKRFQEPVLTLEELPKIDYIVISHDHYDHLDMKSIAYFKNEKTKFIVPLGLSPHLSEWGINQDKVSELDWWETIENDGLTFIATPAQHFSGRTGIEQNQTLWASWIIRSNNHSLYFSGDSGYYKHFQEIGNKYGPFDIAFLENGQYDEQWQTVHMLPEQTIQAFKDLKGKKLMSVHWGMFDIANHNWFDPIEAVSALSEKDSIDHLTPLLGESINVLHKNQTQKWWKPLMKDN